MVNFGHEDRLVKGLLDLVDDGALDVICLMEFSDKDVVLADTFYNLCCRSIVDSEWCWVC